MNERARRAALLLAALVLSSPFPAGAWPAEAYRGMVYDALAMLPPSLSRVLARRDEWLLEGVQSLQGETASTIARTCSAAGRSSSSISARWSV